MIPPSDAPDTRAALMERLERMEIELSASRAAPRPSPEPVKET